MLFLQVSTHTAESCPIHNEKMQKLFADVYNKMGPLAKKYGVKMIGSWVVPNEHTGYDVLEAPSLDAVTKLLMEPVAMAMASFEKFELKVAFSSEEIAKMMEKLAK